ncbi:MAG: DUF177 domain-containing protein [Flavobacteriales bacterium]|nr:DUF177 domain-containing protein [Flavobacteriales bacterium]MBP9078722.1 DUF177 domain-containing protein [Flavobacteriales bacterium]
MEALAEHTINFTGLKDGAHRFHYKLGAAFFEASADDDFIGGAVDVQVGLEKNSHLLVATIQVEGQVDMLCDHCNAPMHQHVQGDQRQIFKLTGELETDEDELVGLDPQAHEINLTHYIYECITLHLPSRHVHPAGECDPAVTDALENVLVSHEPDPRWAKLNELKKNKSA